MTNDEFDALFPRLAEPLADIEFGNPDATAWESGGVRLTGVDLLAIVAAETYVNALAVEWWQRSSAGGGPFPPADTENGGTD